jgi:hypothetical protein
MLLYVKYIQHTAQKKRLNIENENFFAITNKVSRRKSANIQKKRHP